MAGFDPGSDFDSVSSWLTVWHSRLEPALRQDSPVLVAWLLAACLGPAGLVAAFVRELVAGD